ncbi:MAG: histidine triad nucleotide-binding protein [Armatimonadota bacterium]
MAEDCLFCSIAAGEIDSEIVHKDEHCVAFRDINPQAPTHILVIPRKHIAGIAETDAADQELLGHLLLTVADVARDEGIAESGYRTVINWGRDGGMEVAHLHIHVLGGRAMSWPPG